MEFLVGKNNLLYTTILPFSSAYYISTKGLTKEKREWCPLCYREQEKNFETTFDLLIWTIKGVKICLVHKTKLVGNCGDYSHTIVPPLTSFWSTSDIKLVQLCHREVHLGIAREKSHLMRQKIHLIRTV